MAKAISVRLDEETERALHTLESSGLTRSEAIRTSLFASAARLRRGREFAAEEAALEADEADRQEMLAVASLIKSMRAPGGGLPSPARYSGCADGDWKTRLAPLRVAALEAVGAAACVGEEPDGFVCSSVEGGTVFVQVRAGVESPVPPIQVPIGP